MQAKSKRKVLDFRDYPVQLPKSKPSKGRNNELTAVQKFIKDFKAEEDDILYDLVYSCDDFLEFRKRAFDHNIAYNFEVAEAKELYDYIIEKHIL